MICFNETSTGGFGDSGSVSSELCEAVEKDDEKDGVMRQFLFALWWRMVLWTLACRE